MHRGVIVPVFYLLMKVANSHSFCVRKVGVCLNPKMAYIASIVYPIMTNNKAVLIGCHIRTSYPIWLHRMKELIDMEIWTLIWSGIVIGAPVAVVLKLASILLNADQKIIVLDADGDDIGDK
jgi:hypothetical protein